MIPTVTKGWSPNFISRFVSASSLTLPLTCFPFFTLIGSTVCKILHSPSCLSYPWPSLAVPSYEIALSFKHLFPRRPSLVPGLRYHVSLQVPSLQACDSPRAYLRHHTHLHRSWDDLFSCLSHPCCQLRASWKNHGSCFICLLSLAPRQSVAYVGAQ